MKGYNLIDTGQSINHTHFTNKLHLIYLYLYYMASLPQPLAAKIKSIPMDPLALANNVQLAYMLSFSNYGISLSTQPYPMIRSNVVQRIPITPLSNAIILLILMILHTKLSMRKPRRTMKSKIRLLSNASEIVSKIFSQESLL